MGGGRRDVVEVHEAHLPGHHPLQRALDVQRAQVGADGVARAERHECDGHSQLVFTSHEAVRDLVQRAVSAHHDDALIGREVFRAGDLAGVAGALCEAGRALDAARGEEGDDDSGVECAVVAHSAHGVDDEQRVGDVDAVRGGRGGGVGEGRGGHGRRRPQRQQRVGEGQRGDDEVQDATACEAGAEDEEERGGGGRGAGEEEEDEGEDDGPQQPRAGEEEEGERAGQQAGHQCVQVRGGRGSGGE